jgi:transcriptional regulator
MKQRYQNRIELLQGTLDLLILQTLQWGPQHGYGITQAIRTNSGEVLQVDTGSLYPALYRLERQKWISSDWKVSERKQRVKVYQLTLSGKKQLLLQRSCWEQFSEAMAGVLNPAREEGGA